jgi:hypothetical protein
MEYIHNNLMKLEGSLGNIPQKIEKIVLKLDIFRTLVHFQENILTFGNISSFYNGFFFQFLWIVT